MNEAAPPQVPDWLSKDYLAHDSAWEPQAQAWLVMPLKHPKTGQPLPQQHEEDERDEPEDQLPLQSRAADMGCHRNHSRVLTRRRAAAITDGDRMPARDRSRLGDPKGGKRG